MRLKYILLFFLVCAAFSFYQISEAAEKKPALLGHINRDTASQANKPVLVGHINPVLVGHIDRETARKADQ